MLTYFCKTVFKIVMQEEKGIINIICSDFYLNYSVRWKTAKMNIWHWSWWKIFHS